MSGYIVLCAYYCDVRCKFCVCSDYSWQGELFMAGLDEKLSVSEELVKALKIANTFRGRGRGAGAPVSHLLVGSSCKFSEGISIIRSSC